MAFTLAAAATAEPVTNLQWQYTSDRVMGGISDGSASLEDGAIRLQGTVSTANNGGFIQFRTKLAQPGLPGTGVGLRVKGNGETYLVHLRTTQTRRPWHYFRAAFSTTEDWADVELRWPEFSAAAAGMTQTFDPSEVISIGIVAYGRDFEADMMVSDIRILP